MMARLSRRSTRLTTRSARHPKPNNLCLCLLDVVQLLFPAIIFRSLFVNTNKRFLVQKEKYVQVVTKAKHFPHVIVLSAASVNLRSTQSISERNKVRKLISFPMVSDLFLEGMMNEEDWDIPQAFEHDDCKLPHAWQKKAGQPNCNSIHEISLAVGDPQSAIYLAQGGWRDVWGIPSAEQATKGLHILKTIRLEDDYFSQQHLMDQQLDAQISNRLSASPHVVDIYSYCGGSAMYPVGKEDLSRTIFRKLNHRDPTNRTKLLKLRIAAQITKALADTHNVDVEENISVAHRDLAPDQFISVNGVFQLNDFNKASLIVYSNNNSGVACTLQESPMNGITQSPEEYKEVEFSAEKADVYALGNVFYSLLTGRPLFYGIDEEDAIDAIIQGHRSHVPRHLLFSTNPLEQVLLQVMRSFQKQNAIERMTAREAQQRLESVLRDVDPSWKLTDPYNVVS